MRHRSRDYSIRHTPFPIGGPLETILYFQPFSSYWAQKLLTKQQTRRIAIPPSGGICWWRSIVVRLPVLAGELSLIPILR